MAESPSSEPSAPERGAGRTPRWSAPATAAEAALRPLTDAYAYAVAAYGDGPRQKTKVGGRAVRVRTVGGCTEAVVRGSEEGRPSAAILDVFLRVLHHAPALLRSAAAAAAAPPEYVPSARVWNGASAPGGACAAVPHPERGPNRPPVGFIYGTQVWGFGSAELALRGAQALGVSPASVVRVTVAPGDRVAWCAATAMGCGRPPSCMRGARKDFLRWMCRARARWAAKWTDGRPCSEAALERRLAAESRIRPEAVAGSPHAAAVFWVTPEQLRMTRVSSSGGSASYGRLPAGEAPQGCLPDAASVFYEAGAARAALAVQSVDGHLEVDFGVLTSGDTLRILHDVRYKLVGTAEGADEFVRAMLSTATRDVQMALLTTQRRKPPPKCWVPPLMRMRLLRVSLVRGADEVRLRSRGAPRAITFADAAGLFADERAAVQCEQRLVERHRAEFSQAGRGEAAESGARSMFSGAADVQPPPDARVVHRMRLALDAACSPRSALHAVCGALGGCFVAAGDEEGFAGTLRLRGLPHALTVGREPGGGWSARSSSISASSTHFGDCAATALLAAVLACPATAAPAFWAAVLASPPSTTRLQVARLVAAAGEEAAALAAASAAPDAADVWDAALGEHAWSQFVEDPTSGPLGPAALLDALEVVSHGALLRPAVHEALCWSEEGAGVLVRGSLLALRVSWNAQSVMRFEWFGAALAEGAAAAEWAAGLFVCGTAVWRCTDAAGLEAIETLAAALVGRGGVRHGNGITVAWGNCAAASSVTLVLSAREERPVCVSLAPLY